MGRDGDGDGDGLTRGTRAPREKKASEEIPMRTVTTLVLLLVMCWICLGVSEVYQRVRLPVAWSSWISGAPGMTVGMGNTEEVGVEPATVGKSLKSAGTIMMASR